MLTGQHQKFINNDNRLVDAYQFKYGLPHLEWLAKQIGVPIQEVINHVAQLPGHGYVAQLVEPQPFPSIDQMVRQIEGHLDLIEFELEELENLTYNTIHTLYREIVKNS
jgi:hypothetical protein